MLKLFSIVLIGIGLLPTGIGPRTDSMRNLKKKTAIQKNLINYDGDLGHVFMVGSRCKFYPVFEPNTYSSKIPFGNKMRFTYSDQSSLVPNFAYKLLLPGKWFTPNPTIATSSPPNRVAHNPSSIGCIGIAMVKGQKGTISFDKPLKTGFYMHVYQTLSRLDFDRSFTIVSSDGDVDVGNSGKLSNNVLLPLKGPGTADDTNATIYFSPGVSRVSFKVTYTPYLQDGIRLAFTFPDSCASSANKNR